MYSKLVMSQMSDILLQNDKLVTRPTCTYFTLHILSEQKVDDSLITMQGRIGKAKGGCLVLSSALLQVF